jgi:hypothetical protein
MTDPANEDRVVIEWTRPMLDRFNIAIARAIENNEDEIMFDGNKFITKYAVYLSEYLRSKFYPISMN